MVNKNHRGTGSGKTENIAIAITHKQANRSLGKDVGGDLEVGDKSK